MMEVLIHSFAMASQTYALQKYTRFQADWYRYGITSTVCGCLACTVAVYAIRKHWYEIFLGAHVTLVVMFLWTGWKFYWTCCAIWVFDRFIRLCRIALNGVHTATVEFFPGDDATIKVHVMKSKLYRQFSPGSHAFISFLSKNTFWQNHPFTAYESVTDPETIIFCCRVKKGVIRTIANKFKGSDLQTMQMRVLLEGFYGEQSYYQQYDKSVFIAGNTGIVGPFSHVEKLVSSGTASRQVELYWGIRSYDALKWFGPGLLSLKGKNVISKVYISQPERSSVNSSTDSTDSDHKKDEGEGVRATEKKLISQESEIDLQQVLEFVEIIHGRMPVTEIIETELKENIGAVAFGACAHTQVVDLIRIEIARRLPTSDKRVDYFEEMQTW